MTQLIIQDLKLYAYHGVYDFEKQQGQPFLIQAVIDLHDPGEIDDQLSDTLSYVDCLDTIRDTFLAKKYDLVEYAAQEICRKLLALDERVAAVDITILKTKPPVEDDLGALGVRLCRSSTSA